MRLLQSTLVLETRLDHPGYRGSWLPSGRIYSAPPSLSPFPLMVMVRFSQTAVVHICPARFLVTCAPINLRDVPEV